MNREHRRDNKNFHAWLGQIYAIDLTPQNLETMQDQHVKGYTPKQTWDLLQKPHRKDQQK